jgi:hypothetical protein
MAGKIADQGGGNSARLARLLRLLSAHKQTIMPDTVATFSPHPLVSLASITVRQAASILAKVSGLGLDGTSGRGTCRMDGRNQESRA